MKRIAEENFTGACVRVSETVSKGEEGRRDDRPADDDKGSG